MKIHFPIPQPSAKIRNVNQLIALDHQLFVEMNSHWTHWLLDLIMPNITDFHKQPWIVFGVVPILALYWIYRRRNHAIRTLLSLTLAVGLSDGLSFRVLKPLIQRDRPEFSGVPVVLRTHHHSGASFPSNHAANNFAAAMILSGAFPSMSWLFFVAASLIGYSRIYIGVHFPADVLGGAILGLLSGLFIRMTLWRWLCRKLKSDEDCVPVQNSNHSS